MSVKPIPEGMSAITSSLVVKGASDAIEFYKKAFDAQEIYRMNGPDGKSIIHAMIRIGDSSIMLNDEMPHSDTHAPKSAQDATTSLHLYVEDAEKTFAKAIEAGATITMPIMDAFWGDRYGRIADPFGHVWAVATHQKDMSPEEIRKAGESFFANMPK